MPTHCPYGGQFKGNDRAMLTRKCVAGKGLMENVTLYFTKSKRVKEGKRERGKE